jgi:hypothetical protein
MRSALALGLLIVLSASADAATVHHSCVHHSHVVLPAGVPSGPRHHLLQDDGVGRF